MKLILAAIFAGSFLVSVPVRADDKPAGDTKSEKGKKDKKSDKKADKGDKGADQGAKPSGGGW
jgi:hypothetical protein